MVVLWWTTSADALHLAYRGIMLMYMSNVATYIANTLAHRQHLVNPQLYASSALRLLALFLPAALLLTRCSVALCSYSVVAI